MQYQLVDERAQSALVEKVRVDGLHHRVVARGDRAAEHRHLRQGAQSGAAKIAHDRGRQVARADVI